MYLPPRLSELKGTSQTLGQLDFRSLLGLSSPLEHKLVEVMMTGKFLFCFIIAISQESLWSFSSIPFIFNTDSWWGTVDRERTWASPAAEISREAWAVPAQEGLFWLAKGIHLSLAVRDLIPLLKSNRVVKSMQQFMEVPCEHLKTVVLFSIMTDWKAWSVFFLVCGGRWQRLLRAAVCNETVPCWVRLRDL